MRRRRQPLPPAPLLLVWFSVSTFVLHTCRRVPAYFVLVVPALAVVALYGARFTLVSPKPLNDVTATGEPVAEEHGVRPSDRSLRKPRYHPSSGILRAPRTVDGGGISRAQLMMRPRCGGAAIRERLPMSLTPRCVVRPLTLTNRSASCASCATLHRASGAAVLSISAELFERPARLAAALRMARPATRRRLTTCCGGDQRHRPPSLTFDDGYRDTHDRRSPAAAYEAKAIVFVLARRRLRAAARVPEIEPHQLAIPT